MRRSRPLLCCHCESWEESENIELGICRVCTGSKHFEDFTTWYNQRCVWGLSEYGNNQQKKLEDK